MPKQVSYQNPPARNHKTMTISHSHRAMHEPSGHSWVKPFTSVIFVQTDIQHSVKTLSRSMTHPTMIAMRRLKKLTRYLLGTTDVRQELLSDRQAEVWQVPVDSDWADCKETRQSCSGGPVLFHGCAVLTWARTQKTRALSSEEAELYAVGSGAIEGLGAAQLLQEWQYKTVPLLWTDSQSAVAVYKRRGPAIV